MPKDDESKPAADKSAEKPAADKPAAADDVAKRLKDHERRIAELEKRDERIRSS